MAALVNVSSESLDVELVIDPIVRAGAIDERHKVQRRQITILLEPPMPSYLLHGVILFVSHVLMWTVWTRLTSGAPHKGAEKSQ